MVCAQMAPQRAPFSHRNLAQQRTKSRLARPNLVSSLAIHMLLIQQSI